MLRTPSCRAPRCQPLPQTQNPQAARRGPESRAEGNLLKRFTPPWFPHYQRRSVQQGGEKALGRAWPRGQPLPDLRRGVFPRASPLRAKPSGAVPPLQPALLPASACFRPAAPRHIPPSARPLLPRSVPDRTPAPGCLPTSGCSSGGSFPTAFLLLASLPPFPALYCSPAGHKNI